MLNKRVSKVQPEYFYEGEDWLNIYKTNPDPSFVHIDLELRDKHIPLFCGRIPLNFWLGISAPLPSIPVTFWGSPVTDLFPFKCDNALDKGIVPDIVNGVVDAALHNRSWAAVVKDLPAGHLLEQSLSGAGFIPVDHDPIWYMPVPDSLQTYLQGLSTGRKRGIEGRWRRFRQNVTTRPATKNDIDFIKYSYETVWVRSKMRLERLTSGFFSNSLLHPNCSIFIFERDKTPFAFAMLWQYKDIWFDKYIGTDNAIYKEVSFYSMSILHLLDIAPYHGIKWYVAGQGTGQEKAGLGFSSIPVKLWIKPLLLDFIASPLISRFMRAHNKRIYTANAL